ncbi:unnamed protein product, partial [Ectocarpus sp. 12 AP-2014]
WNRKKYVRINARPCGRSRPTFLYILSSDCCRALLLLDKKANIDLLIGLHASQTDHPLCVFFTDGTCNLVVCYVQSSGRVVEYSYKGDDTLTTFVRVADMDYVHTN